VISSVLLQRLRNRNRVELAPDSGFPSFTSSEPPIRPASLQFRRPAVQYERARSASTIEGCVFGFPELPSREEMIPMVEIEMERVLPRPVEVNNPFDRVSQFIDDDGDEVEDEEQGTSV